MRSMVLFSCASLTIAVVTAQNPGARKKEDGPQPTVVSTAGRVPSDAIVLFDGKDLANWLMSDGSPAEWTVKDGELICRTGTGDLHSKLKFHSAQVHLEFNVPLMPEHKGQARGNSGVMFHARGNEIQILDSHQNPTYADGSCGGFYGVAPPLVNASRPPGEWQTYDIVYRAPACAPDGAVKNPGAITVLHNGVVVQDQVPVSPRNGCLEEGPLILQDHNGFGGKRVPPSTTMKAPITPMRFRNIWIRRLPR